MSNASSLHTLADALLHTVAEAILLTDAQGRLTALNPAAEKLFPRAALEAKHSPLALSAVNAELGGWLAQARRAENGRPLAFEIELSEHFFAATLAPLPDGWLLTLRDVTHIRQAEQWRGETVQAAAHDLRNPLNLLAGSVNLLAETLPSPTPDQAECLVMLRLGVERMNGLIDQLLSLEQAQGGQSRHPVLLHDVLQNAVSEFQISAAEKQIRLTFEGAPTSALILGAEDWLRRAIANLLSNALKYTPAGGRIAARYHEAEGQAIVEVTDTGIGVPSEAQPHLFERFYRVKNAATRNIPGSGLGLAIVKVIIEQHGGRVWVSSVEGQGSTFGFSIPLAP